MYTQPHTTTTPRPTFWQPTHQAVKSIKAQVTASVNETAVKAEVEAEAIGLAAVSICDKDYKQIADYILNHCDEIEDNYYTCTLDRVDFDLACGATVELTGDATMITDFSQDEYLLTGYNGQPERFIAGIDCVAYNEQGDVARSDFDQARIKKYI